MGGTTKKYDVVILFSGGLDSAVLVKLALFLGYVPLCVIVNYGQLQSIEIEKAIKFCQKEKVDYKIFNVEYPVRSALTTGEKNLYKGVSTWYVPSRNLMFVSLAAATAEENDIGKIWYGANFSDHVNRFPDCEQDWISRTNDVLKINGSKPITLYAPLLGYSKAMVLDLAKRFKINLEEVFSGYIETT